VPVPDRDALARGEPAAVEAFYRENARTVLRWVIRLGGPRLDAEDVAHDVFVTALRNVGRYRPDHKPEAWLFGITRRVVANARRKVWLKRMVGLEREPPSVEPGADVRLDRLRRRRLVQEVLDTLSEAHREVLVLFDLDGRTAPEVAEMLGLSVGTVYSRLHHARRRFAEALGAGRSALDHAAMRDALLEEDR
jgi:RNA polymerase sigma-70 factor (ECF subfamily)